jgi:hypothetical protein
MCPLQGLGYTIYMCVCACVAGYLYGGGGEPKQWNQRMKRLFNQRSLCFSKQYDRQNMFLFVSIIT